MLTQEQADLLGQRLEKLQCIDPKAGDGLFLFVFKGEPLEEAPRYEMHLRDCEYCRIAREIYQYKRDIGELLGKDLSRNETR